MSIAEVSESPPPPLQNILDTVKWGNHLSLTNGLALSYVGVDPSSNQDVMTLTTVEAMTFSQSPVQILGVPYLVVQATGIVCVWRA